MQLSTPRFRSRSTNDALLTTKHRVAVMTQSRDNMQLSYHGAVILYSCADTQNSLYKLLMIKNYHILLPSLHEAPLSIKHIVIISYNHLHRTVMIYCYYPDISKQYTLTKALWKCRPAPKLTMHAKVSSNPILGFPVMVFPLQLTGFLL